MTSRSAHKVDLVGLHYDVDEFKSTLCVNSGKVEFRAWVDGDKEMDVQIYGGGCWAVHGTSGIFNMDSFLIRTDILSESANYFLVVKWNQ